MTMSQEPTRIEGDPEGPEELRNDSVIFGPFALLFSPRDTEEPSNSIYFHSFQSGPARGEQHSL